MLCLTWLVRLCSLGVVTACDRGCLRPKLSCLDVSVVFDTVVSPKAFLGPPITPTGSTRNVKRNRFRRKRGLMGPILTLILLLILLKAPLVLLTLPNNLGQLEVPKILEVTSRPTLKCLGEDICPSSPPPGGVGCREEVRERGWS